MKFSAKQSSTIALPDKLQLQHIVGLILLDRVTYVHEEIILLSFLLG